MRPYYRPLQAATVLTCLTLLACPAKKTDGDKPVTDESATAAQNQDSPAAAGGNIAEVNGVAISRAAFDAQFERTRDRFKQGNRQIPPALEVRLKENILRRLVEDQLIAQKAKAEGVALTDEEFEQRFAEHRKRFGTDQAYQDFLKRTHQTEEQLRGELRKSLLRERLYSKMVPDTEPGEEDAKKYYETNVKRYIEPEQIKASHILLSYKASDDDKIKKEKMAKCKKLFKKARAKGADFAKLARENSEGPTASRGGDLGTFPRGRMVKAFEEVAFAAKAGKVVGPVETQFGCHVIKVVEKKPQRQRPFDEVKASVLATLKAIKKSEQTRNLLTELRRNAKVKVLDPALKYQAPPMPRVATQAAPAGATAKKPVVMPKPNAAPAPKPASQSNP